MSGHIFYRNHIFFLSQHNKKHPSQTFCYEKESRRNFLYHNNRKHAARTFYCHAKKEDVRRFREAGADILLFPAPGSVPGITVSYVKELVSYAHSLGALTITAIGTSQEGADTATIRQMALMCKMTGTDIHHLGDAGYAGMALPENIQAYSVAVRGIRHTYHRMAASILR